jgi:hypothetical protein
MDCSDGYFWLEACKDGDEEVELNDLMTKRT